MTFSKMHSAGFLANHMARLFATTLQRRLRDLGLAPAQFMVLLELWEQNGLTQVDLTRRLDVEQATMANTLSRMERDGLIQRIPSGTDRRVKVTVLTQKALDLQSEAILAAADVNIDALKELSDFERQDLVRLMQKVISALKQA